jgi:hypothetical protein
MRTKIAALVVGGVLLGGAAVANAQEQTTTTTTATVGSGHHRGELAETVLADLVADGTITQVQADAIVAAFEAQRAEMQENRTLLEGFWEDDVLTAEEIAQLNEPNRFTATDSPFAEALADGELTRDEVEAIRDERRAHFEEVRDLVEGFLEDGVLTSDEIAQLPEPNPFTEDGPFADALSDGQLTQEELDEARPQRGERGGQGRRGEGAGFGA